MINYCYLFGVKQDTFVWRIDHVMPILKTGGKNEMTNYRPISLASATRKLLEHVLSFIFMEYMTNKILVLFAKQHSFQQRRSC